MGYSPSRRVLLPTTPTAGPVKPLPNSSRKKRKGFTKKRAAERKLFQVACEAALRLPSSSDGLEALSLAEASPPPPPLCGFCSDEVDAETGQYRLCGEPVSPGSHYFCRKHLKYEHCVESIYDVTGVELELVKALAKRKATLRPWAIDPDAWEAAGLGLNKARITPGRLRALWRHGAAAAPLAVDCAG